MFAAAAGVGAGGARPHDCSITRRQAVNCEPYLRDNILWSCKLSGREYKFESSYHNHPLRDANPFGHAKESEYYDHLADLATRPGLLQRLLDNLPPRGLGDYIVDYLPQVIGSLLAVLISLWLCAWVFPRQRRKFKQRAELRRHETSLSGSSSAADLNLVPKWSRWLIFGAELVLTVGLLAAIVNQFWNISTGADEYRVLNCVSSKNIYRLVYGDFVPSNEADDLGFEGFVRLYASVNALGAMTMGSVLSSLQMDALLRTSLKSLWGPVWLTDANLRTTRYLALPAFHGDYGATPLRHRLAIAAAFEYKDRFKWSKVYSAHIAVLEASHAVAKLPEEILSAMEEVISRGRIVISTLEKFFDVLLGAVDGIRQQINSLQAMTYGESTATGRGLRIVPALFILVQAFILILIVVCWVVVERQKHFRASKRYYASSSIQGFLSGCCILIGVVIICGMSVASDSCRLVINDLLGADRWAEYPLILKAAGQTNILSACMYKNSTGSVLEAVSAEDAFAKLQQYVEQSMRLMNDLIATSLQNIFWILPEPRIPKEVIELAKENPEAIAYMIPDVISHPNLFVMTDPRIIWSVPNYTGSGPKEINDEWLHPWLRDALIAQWEFARRHDVKGYPSHMSALLWATNNPPHLYTPADASRAFRDSIPSICSNHARNFCVSWDPDCPKKHAVGSDAYMYIPEELFQSEQTLLNSARISVGNSDLADLEKNGVRLHDDYLGLTWKFYGWRKAVRQQELIPLWDCLVANSKSISSFEVVEFLTATYQVTLKGLLTDPQPLFRSWSYREQASKEAPDYYEICEAVRECPLFVAPLRYNQTKTLTGLPSPYFDISFPPWVPPIPDDSSDGAPPLDLTHDFELVPPAKFGRILPAWIIRAARMKNSELGSFTQEQIIMTNPVYRLWKSIDALPSTQNCRVVRSFLEDVGKAGCLRAGPALANLGFLITIAGIVGLLLTGFHVMVLRLYV